MRNEVIRDLLLVSLALGLCLLLVVAWGHIDSTRVVAEARTSDGVEIKVEQRFTRSGDLFNTSFFYRKPGEEWRWGYYSHEDSYWGRGRVELDEKQKLATIYRDGKPTIQFDWATEVYTQFTHTQSGKPLTRPRDE